MNEPTNQPAEELEHLVFVDDPDYWDYLDQREHEMAGSREWDMPLSGGASR